MGANQYSLSSLMATTFCAGVGLGFGKIAAMMHDNGPSGIAVCVLAGTAFGFAHWVMLRRRYAAMLFGFMCSGIVATATLPAVVIS